MSLRRLLTLACLLLCVAAPLRAACVGQNMFDALPAETRAELAERLKTIPFAEGNFWMARRDGQVITLVGTYHLDDPRHAETMEWLTPKIARADLVLVEAGRQEQKALADRIAADPGILVSDGPTLPELLPQADWQALSRALRDRGIPPMMGARFRPWYIAALLAVPPCLGKEGATELGLDGAIIATAARKKVPVKALEPYDTVLGFFDSFSGGEEVAMIQSALATEARSTDYNYTMAEAYFTGQSALIWQMTRDQTTATPGADPKDLAEGFDKIERRMIIDRNHAWIPVIEKAAAKGEIIAAFGALHLPGQEGVLNLLAQQGWQIIRLGR